MSSSLRERRPLLVQRERGLEVLLLAGLFWGTLRGQPLHRLLLKRRHLHGLTPGWVFKISTVRVNKVCIPAGPEGADLLGKVPQTDSCLNSEEPPCCLPPAHSSWLLPLQLNQIIVFDYFCFYVSQNIFFSRYYVALFFLHFIFLWIGSYVGFEQWISRINIFYKPRTLKNSFGIFMDVFSEQISGIYVSAQHFFVCLCRKNDSLHTFYPNFVALNFKYLEPGSSNAQCSRRHLAAAVFSSLQKEKKKTEEKKTTETASALRFLCRHLW